MGKTDNLKADTSPYPEYLLFVREFYYLMCPPLSPDHRNIEINNTDKPSLCTSLFIGNN